MRFAYQLLHKHFIELDEETGDEICDTKFLGVFSSRKKCKEVIPYYIQQPGFCDHPKRFFIERIEADVNDFNDTPGEFSSVVYTLEHEWYDGEYDHVTKLGYYSSQEKAEAAQADYASDPDLKDHPDDFMIGKCVIDRMEWKEGFCSWEEMDEN